MIAMPRHASAFRQLTILAALVLLASACQAATPTAQPPAAAPQATSAPQATTAPATSAAAQPTTGTAQAKLSSVCPNPTVVQLNFAPEAERGGFLALIDPAKGTVDNKKGIYSGPAQADPNLTVEVRAGGGSVGFQDSLALAYQNPEILLFEDNMDTLISLSKAQPSVALMTPLKKFPQILMWNPAVLTFKTIQDIRDSGVTVLVSANVTYAAVLVAKGLLKKEQVDYSYNFAPDRFVAANGKIAQQGFSTSEPFLYQNVIAAWKKPVQYMYIADNGYDNYGVTVATKASNVKDKGDCLKLLIPAVQKAYVEFINHPDPYKTKLSDFAKATNTAVPEESAVIDYAIKTMIGEGIVETAPGGTFGGIDMTKVQNLIKDVIPVFQAKGSDKFNPDLKASDMATSQFLDPTVSVKPK